MTTSKKKSGTRKKNSPGKSATRKNKPGIENSLVNNINARKKKGTARPKKKSTISKKQYKAMENDWKK